MMASAVSVTVYVRVLVYRFLCVCHVLTINNLNFACLYLQFNEQTAHDKR